MTGKAKAECRSALTAAILLLLPLALGACADLDEGPYTDDTNWPNPTYLTVVVRPGDTVSAIAARYQVTSAELTGMNHLDVRGEIHPGQVLRVTARSRETQGAVLLEATDRNARNFALPLKPIEVARYDSQAPVHVRQLPEVDDKPLRPVQLANATLAAQSPTGLSAAAKDPQAPRFDDGPARFVWPLEGQVISPFGSAGNGEKNDGINIATTLGAPIHASAAGTVTYVGNELKGYGNLILIRHDDGYITAYAHAQSISVGRGDRVDRGQIIGYAGATGDVDRPQLHFEIRKGVQPINPKLLLAAR